MSDNFKDDQVQRRIRFIRKFLIGDGVGYTTACQSTAGVLYARKDNKSGYTTVVIGLTVVDTSS